MEYTIKGTIEIDGQKVQIEGASPQLVSSVIKEVLGTKTVRSGNLESSAPVVGRIPKQTKAVRARSQWSGGDVLAIARMVLENPEESNAETSTRARKWIMENGDNRGRSMNSIRNIVQRMRRSILLGDKTYLSPRHVQALKRLGVDLGEMIDNAAESNVAEDSEERQVPVRIVSDLDSRTSYLDEA